MALEFEKLSPHLKEVLLNLKHMSPTQRFNEVTKPRFELQWQTVAFRYGVEKLEREGWMIPDQEVLNPTPRPERTTNSPRRHGDTVEIGGSGNRGIGGLEKQNPKANTLPLIHGKPGQVNEDHADQQQKQESPQRTQSAEEIGVSGDRGIGGLEKQNPKANTLPLIHGKPGQVNEDHADQEQNQNPPRRHGDAEEMEGSEKQKLQSNTSPLINTDCADQEQKQESPQRTQSAEEIGGSGDRVIGRSESPTPEPVAEESMSREQMNRLYGGDDRRYVDRPEVEEERQHSIEMAARIAAAGNTQLNGRWQVLRDEEVLQPGIRAEIEERGGVDAIPLNEDFVLARDGRVMYKTQLQHALERELRDKLGVPEAWETDQKKILWHKEQLARLEKADAAPRCEHIYSDGTTCQAPKLKTGQWCYAHERMKSVRSKKLSLLPTEDANSIMLNLGDIARALIQDEISEKKAGLLMYNQQLGLIALSRVTFKETDGRLMVREAPEVLPQRTVTKIARNAKSAKESKLRGKRRNLHHGDTETRRKNPKKSLPLINDDGTDHADERLQPSGGIATSAKESELKIAGSTLIPASTEEITVAVHRESATGATARTSSLIDEERAQAGVPVPHEHSVNAGVPPHRANCGGVEDTGLPPHKTNTGFCGDPGVECSKSNGFGVDGGGYPQCRSGDPVIGCSGDWVIG